MGLLALIYLTESQKQVYDSDRPIRVVAASRRWGKDVMARFETHHTLLSEGDVLWISPDTNMVNFSARAFMDSARLFPGTIVKMSHTEFSIYDHRVNFIPVQVVRELTAGRRYALVVVDEASFIKSYYLRTLLQYNVNLTSRLLILSTPDEGSLFNRLVITRADDPNYAIFNFPMSSNSYILPDQAIELKKTLSDRLYRQEIEAEILELPFWIFLKNAVELNDWGRIWNLTHDNDPVEMEKTALAIDSLIQSGYLVKNIDSIEPYYRATKRGQVTAEWYFERKFPQVSNDNY